jgi:hypothetical protein
MLFHALSSSTEFDGTPPCYIMHAFSYEPQNPWLFLSIASETLSKVYFGQTFQYPNFGYKSIFGKTFIMPYPNFSPLSLSYPHMPFSWRYLFSNFKVQRFDHACIQSSPQPYFISLNPCWHPLTITLASQNSPTSLWST